MIMDDDSYRLLDRPEILGRLFHPRPEWPTPELEPAGRNLLIPTAEGPALGARFHVASSSGPSILFFHGNGEIVADYDDLGRICNRMGVNFLAVDYRGYGRSTGSPTVAAMMRDCHTALAFAETWLRDNGCKGPLLVMGRSLGSASAIELAAMHPDALRGLVVESGFAMLTPVLARLGVDTTGLGLPEDAGPDNAGAMRLVGAPTLVIHAEQDEIIPFAHGRALFEACAAPRKRFLPVPGAGHNDIMVRSLHKYLAAIAELVRLASA